MIIVEILYFLIIFSIKIGSSPNQMLFFTTPLIVFSIFGLAEFIIWASKKFDKNEKSSKIKLVFYLTATMLMIVVNVTLVKMSLNPRV
ncbi:hypothetical protein [uncultured Fenollaria sp.]|uniref:hypothetical protein n=1 Tax=uncultured Fenollaria sp. TaxID=1686315 RepID=UPI0025FAD8C2|nr:hypothetical protein [uncultured Fenollaria sp.]